jgi:hypothetical protein
MNSGVLVPATAAAGVIMVRAIVGQKRAPYPYEFLSWGIVYGGIGMIGDAGFSEAMAWGYLVAMLVAPSFADVWKLIPTGKAVPAAKNAAASVKAKANPNPQGLPATG